MKKAHEIENLVTQLANATISTLENKETIREIIIGLIYESCNNYKNNLEFRKEFDLIYNKYR